jgi:hypothetical protein
MNTKVTYKITGIKDDENHPILMDIWLIVNNVRQVMPLPHFITKVPPHNIQIYPIAFT